MYTSLGVRVLGIGAHVHVSRGVVVLFFQDWPPLFAYQAVIIAVLLVLLEESLVGRRLALVVVC